MFTRGRPGKRVGLPQYSWDSRVHNYVDLRTGRFVKREKVVTLLRNVTNHVDDTMANMTRLFMRGKLSPAQYERAVQLLLKQTYNANTALAKGGWERLTAFDYGRNGGYLRSEYFHLRKFIDDMVQGKVSEAQAEARARLYGNSAYSRYFEVQREEHRSAGFSFERRITVGDDKVCEACVALEVLGWQPIGTLPSPGRDPHPGCRCDMIYSREWHSIEGPKKAEEGEERGG